MSIAALERLVDKRISLAVWDLMFPPVACPNGLAALLEDFPGRKRRKPNRSRRIVKKLLKRADGRQRLNINMDAVSVDGGRRWVSGVEIREHGFRYP
ncbi:MAG TPA: hypothetical protein VGE09_08490 [Pseudoxanthomonas sp.]